MTVIRHELASLIRRPRSMTPEDSGAPPPGAEQERALSIPGPWCVFEDWSSEPIRA